MKNPNRNKFSDETELQFFIFDPTRKHEFEAKILVNFKYSIGNDSFDHAFGTQVYPDYIEEVYDIKMTFVNECRFKDKVFKVGDIFSVEKFLPYFSEDYYESTLEGANDADEFMEILERELLKGIEISKEIDKEYDPY